MKRLTRLCFIPLLILGTNLSAQSRFQGLGDFINSQEIVMVATTDASAILRSSQKVVDWDITGLVDEPWFNQNQPTILSSNQVSVSSGDFDGDGYEEYAYARADASGSFTIYIPEADGFDIDTGQSINLPGTIANEPMMHRGILKTTAGDFDGDGQDEFVVGYVIHDVTDPLYGTVTLDLFDCHGTLNPTMAIRMDDTRCRVEYNIHKIEPFDIASADLDRDGVSELIVAWGTDEGGDAMWDIMAKVYDFDFDGVYSYTAKAITQLDSEDTPTGRASIPHIALGSFYKPGKPALLLANAWFDSDIASFQNETSVITYTFDDDPSTTSQDPIELITRRYFYNDDFSPYADQEIITGPFSTTWVADFYPRSTFLPTDVAAGDFTKDGIDEFVVFVGGQYRVHHRTLGSPYDFDIMASLNIYPPASVDLGESFFENETFDHYFNAIDFMLVDDLNRNNWEEILLFTNTQNDNQQHFAIQVFAVDSIDAGSTWAVDAITYPSQSYRNDLGRRKYAIAAPDLDGDRIRLGQATYFQETNMLQPLVILNAPPIHFDQLDGINYDVSECYNGNDCTHQALYKWSLSSAATATVEINSDWGVSSSLSGGGSAFGFGAKTKLSAEYGEGFSNSNSNVQSLKVSTQVIFN